MKPVRIIGTAALALLLSTTVPVWAQQGKHDEEQAKSDKQAKDKGNAKTGKQQGKDQEAAPQAKHKQQQDNQRERNQQNQQAQKEQHGRQQREKQQSADQQNANRQRQAEQKQQVENRQDANRQRQAQQQLDQKNRQQRAQERQGTQRIKEREDMDRRRQQPVVLGQGQQRPPGWDKGNKVGWGDCNVPPGHAKGLNCRPGRDPVLLQAQRQRIQEWDQRRTAYRQRLDQQWNLSQTWRAQLQQQNRLNQYRFQQAYWQRIRLQQQRMNSQSWNRDPYFYTTPNWQYQRDGQYYQTNQYGANQLRQAVNAGYDQGYRAGQADRRDRWNGDYQSSYAYQDANYGYNGMYVGQDDYNYYFRQGFQRGYEDGYGNQMQYGQYSNGNRSILGAILSSILNLQSIR